MKSYVMPNDPDSGIGDLIEEINTYLSPQEVDKVYRAWQLADEAHSGVKRRCGAPYITHPLAVARIIASMRLDVDCVAAALLHDVVEDTECTLDNIQASFGKGVMRLVDAVTKLDDANASKRVVLTATFRKLLAEGVTDIRGIIIKLADRLHNARTFGALPPDTLNLKTKETLEIFVPLARRLSMNHMRRELQKASFKYRNPWRYRILTQQLHNFLAEHEASHQQQLKEVQATLEQWGIKADVFIWPKNVVSAYHRARNKRHGKLSFLDEIRTLELRILVDEKPDCYHALGAVHSLYRPRFGYFRDFIALPKSYGYRSLQTLVMPKNKPHLRIQIQSRAMYYQAEYGATAPYVYPELVEKMEVNDKHLQAWFDQIVYWLENLDDGEDFLDIVTGGLYLNEIRVQTPNGDTKTLKQGATAVDFAYAIHTDIGHHCSMARVNDQYMSLNTPLPHDAEVSIITDPEATPQASWLSHVVTHRARVAIRRWLQNREEHNVISQGKYLLQNALSAFDQDWEDLDNNSLLDVLEILGLPSTESLFKDISEGKQCAKLVARRLVSPELLQLNQDDYENKPLIIQGTEGLVVDVAQCCRPVPGDAVVALLVPRKGLQVHRSTCAKVFKGNHFHGDVLAITWANDVRQAFSVPVRLHVQDHIGVLADLTHVIETLKINIQALSVDGDDENIKHIHIVMKVKHLKQIEAFMHKAEHLSYVESVERL